MGLAPVSLWGSLQPPPMGLVHPPHGADLHHLHRVTSILSMELSPTSSQWISVHPPHRVFSHIPTGLSSSCLWDYLHPPHNIVSILSTTELHHLHGVSSIPSLWDYVCPPHNIFSILPIELGPPFPWQSLHYLLHGIISIIFPMALAPPSP